MNSNVLKIAIAIAVPTLSTAAGGFASYSALKSQVAVTSSKLEEVNKSAAKADAKIDDLNKEREAHALKLQSIQDKVEQVDKKLDDTLEAVDRLDSYIRGTSRDWRDPRRYDPSHAPQK